MESPICGNSTKNKMFSRKICQTGIDRVIDFKSNLTPKVFFESYFFV